MMTKVGFLDAVTYGNLATTFSDRVLEKVDGYLHLSCLGSRTVAVIEKGGYIDDPKYLFQKIKKPAEVVLLKNSPSSCLKTALKILSFTLILPLLIALALKVVLRGSRSFVLVSEKTPSQERATSAFNTVAAPVVEARPDSEEEASPLNISGSFRSRMTPEVRSAIAHKAVVLPGIFSLSSTSAASQQAVQFSPQDLLVFKAALTKVDDPSIIVEVENRLYGVWYDKSDGSIVIQDYTYLEKGDPRETLRMIIDEQGQIISIQTDEAFIGSVIPSSKVLLIYACFIKAFEISSSYKTLDQHDREGGHYRQADIRIVRRGLEELPEFHLEKFSRLIVSEKKKFHCLKLRVSFLGNNLNLSQGIDSGGLSRDYFDDLFKGITENMQLLFQPSGSAVLPRTKKDYANGEPLPLVDQEEKNQLKQVGQILMFCYCSHFNNLDLFPYLIGNHFDPALFAAVLCLSAEEINTPFEKLSLQVKLKMCEALAEATESYGSYRQRLIALLLKLDTLNNQELREAAQIAKTLLSLPEDFDPEKFDPFQPTQVQIVKTALVDSLFGYLGGTTLAPIHAIAQGMKSVCAQDYSNDDLAWNSGLYATSYREFNLKVQGHLDRAYIVNRIKISDDLIGRQRGEIEKKVNWLKEWLIGEDGMGATEQEVRRFLKFITGTSSLPSNVTITANVQQTTLSPIPVSHSCFYQIELSPTPIGDQNSYNDHTKEAFLKCLKEIALTDSGSYSMA